METRLSGKPMGVMQNNLAARYNFSIGNVLSEAWQLINGFKKPFWGAIGWTLLVFLGVAALLGIIGYITGLPTASPDAMQGLINLVTTLVSLPFMVGILMLGIRRSVNIPVQANQVFLYLRRFWAILGVYIVQWIILSVVGLLIMGSILFRFVAEGVGFWISDFFTVVFSLLLLYLAVGYMFAIVLRVEKNLGIFASLKASRKAVNQHWFKVFFTMILMYILLIIGSIPLLIGLIWLMPLVNVMYGVLYRTMFGVEEVR